MSVPGAVAHNKTVVFGVYRLLLRQIGKTFRGRNAISPSTSSSALLTTAEDESTKSQAKRYAREGFDTYRHERFAGTTAAEEGIKHAKGVAQILEQNVVQGVKSKKDENAPYKLNIHERTERGDNESIKQFQGTKKSFKSMKA